MSDSDGDVPGAEACLDVKPYQFEPLRRNTSASREHSDSSESEEDATRDSEPDDDRRTDTTLSWCDCRYCAAMTTNIECMCCNEIPAIMTKIEDSDLSCITLHEGFLANCCNRDVIEVSLYEYVDFNGPLDDNEPILRMYRYVAYRRFVRWIWHIGKRKRKILPACVVTKIRESFPSEEYTGFQYARP